MAGLSTNSRFEGATEWKLPMHVTKGPDLIIGNRQGSRLRP